MNKTFLTRISPIALAVHCFTAGAMSSGEYQVGEGRVNKSETVAIAAKQPESKNIDSKTRK